MVAAPRGRHVLDAGGRRGAAAAAGSCGTRMEVRLQQLQGRAARAATHVAFHCHALRGSRQMWPSASAAAQASSSGCTQVTPAWRSASRDESTTAARVCIAASTQAVPTCRRQWCRGAGEGRGALGSSVPAESGGEASLPATAGAAALVQTLQQPRALHRRSGPEPAPSPQSQSPAFTACAGWWAKRQAGVSGAGAAAVQGPCRLGCDYWLSAITRVGRKAG